MDWSLFTGQAGKEFFLSLISINLTLMLFNLIPLAPLDGHYILPYFLSKNAARVYLRFNAQYGHIALMGLFLLGFVGIPVVRSVHSIGNAIMFKLLIF